MVLHVMNEPESLLLALDHLVGFSASTIGLASLFLADVRGDLFLRLLHSVGEVAVPRSRATIERLVAATIPGEARVETDGSMAFITVSR